jgi:hypothetical protein
VIPFLDPEPESARFNLLIRVGKFSKSSGRPFLSSATGYSLGGDHQLRKGGQDLKAP